MGGDTRGNRGPSRRDFLKGLGATGAGLVGGSIAAAGPAAPSAVGAPVPPGMDPARYAHGHGAPASSVDFGRIFPDLPPFAEATDTVRAALLEVGKPGGIMDAKTSCRPGQRR